MLPEDDELVAVLLEVEPVPVLDAVEPDVILVEVLEDESVPVLLVDPVPILLVDLVPMLFVDPVPMLLLVDSLFPMRTGLMLLKPKDTIGAGPVQTAQSQFTYEFQI